MLDDEQKKRLSGYVEMDTELMLLLVTELEKEKRVAEKMNDTYTYLINI